jgi:hypothetical protein
MTKRGAEHHFEKTEQQRQRQRRREGYRLLWRDRRAQRAAAHGSRPARAIPRITSPLRAMRIAAAALKDPVLIKAVEVLELWGLDGKFVRQVRAALTDIRLIQIDQLYLYGKSDFRGDIGDGRRLDVLEACELVVAEHGLGSPKASFESEVERLRHAWMQTRQVRSVRPPPQIPSS